MNEEDTNAVIAFNNGASRPAAAVCRLHKEVVGGQSMFRPVSVAAVLFTGILSTAGANAAELNTSEVAFAGGAAPAVNLGATDAEQGLWSRIRAEFDDEESDDQRRRRGRWDARDDEDSDSERRRRGRAGNRDDEDSDSERRRGRVGNRDRDRDRDHERLPRRDAGRSGIAFDHGANDGYERGLADGRDGNQHDPVRHRHYRSADRGYDGRLGSREQYRNVYRDGFRDGYERGYRDGDSSRSGRNGRTRLPWPF